MRNRTSLSSEMLPGTIDVLILKILTRGPAHGYAIARHIERVSADVLRIGESSLYPALQRLLVNDWVRAEWGESELGRRARVYRITPTGRIQLDSTSGRINGYLPNIDVTMESAAAYAGSMAIGVVLTGMGNDGAAGAKAIQRAGGLVIAQDEATSVIFGMPAEAIKAANVEQVLGIDDIYAAIEKRVIGLSKLAPVGVNTPVGVK